MDVVIVCPMQWEGNHSLEPRIRRFPSLSSDSILTSTHSILTHFKSYHFSFYLYSEFPIFPLPNPFSIHFYSSSDPPYSKPTPHSMPYLGLAEAGSAIPKSGNRWDSELKTRRSQDWMQQFRPCLGRTESHDQGEDVGGDGEGRRRGYGAVFPFPSFFILF